MFVSYAILALSVSSVLAAPIASSGNGGSSYTGPGGQANGGTVVDDSLVNILNIASGNAGKGGDASSGHALAGSGGGAITNTFLTNVIPGIIPGQNEQNRNGLGGLLNLDIVKRHDGGSAYTGPGGQANGGSVIHPSADRNTLLGGLGLDEINILNINSGNAGDGGDASSGTAVGAQGGSAFSQHNHKLKIKRVSSGGNGGDAYTGVGGQANGGTVYEQGQDGILGDLDILNFNSGNAGKGGVASSGAAIAGEGGSSDGQDTVITRIIPLFSNGQGLNSGDQNDHENFGLGELVSHIL